MSRTSTALSACLLSIWCASCQLPPLDFDRLSTDLASEPAAPPGEARPAAQSAPPPAGNRWADPARDVLFQHCRQCHDGNLTSAIPGALRVFDLVQDPWYGRLTGKQLGGLLVRLRGMEGVAPEDLTTVEEFVGCARDGVCGETGPREK